MDSPPGSEETSSSHLDSIDVQLRILPNKLRIGQIARGKLPAAAFPLLNLVLFPDPEYVHLAASPSYNDHSVPDATLALLTCLKTLLGIGNRVFFH